MARAANAKAVTLVPTAVQTTVRSALLKCDIELVNRNGSLISVTLKWLRAISQILQY